VVARVNAASFWKRFKRPSFYARRRVPAVFDTLSAMAFRRFLAVLFALALLASACSAASPSAVPSGSAGGACATVPEPADMTAWGAPATKPTLLPVLVSNNVTCGQGRLLFLYLDGSNRVASAPDRTAKVAFYDLGRDPGKVVTTADGAFVWTIDGERGMYAVTVDLPEAGLWGAEFTTQAPGSPAETVRLTFPVRESTPTVRVGQKAPASKNPTLADVGGDARKISTDQNPDPAFYTTSVADAIAAKKPFMVIFATPKFCKTAQCGPTLERFKPIAAAHQDVTFINIEPYQLHDVEGQLQPVLSTTGDFQATETTDAWGLLSEPWIFAVDRNGIVRGSYEITISDAELNAILPVITGGT
jgi:hypothetical protein